MLPPRAGRSSDGAIWLGLFVAALLTMGVGTPPPAVVTALLVIGATLALSLWVRVGWLAVVVLVIVGVGLRVGAVYGGYSDVLAVTHAAIRAVLGGLDPYGIGYPESFPPGAPFAYGPAALAWYWPAGASARTFELLVACGLVVVLGIRGRVLGLGIYAVLAPLLVTASDGSNDTSAGLLLLVALLVAQRAPVAGGAALAVVAAFKPYALAWLPPLLAYGGITAPLLAFVGASLACWGPALLLWGPGSIIESFRQADALHVTPYYSLAWVAGGSRILPEPAWQLLRLGVGAGVALVAWTQVRTARSFIVAGTVIFVATLYTGWWSTFAYLAAVAPVVCWHLDDWLGMGEQRVRWPADPVGALSARVDARWPFRRAW